MIDINNNYKQIWGDIEAYSRLYGCPSKNGKQTKISGSREVFEVIMENNKMFKDSIFNMTEKTVEFCLKIFEGYITSDKCDIASVKFGSHIFCDLKLNETLYSIYFDLNEICKNTSDFDKNDVVFLLNVLGGKFKTYMPMLFNITFSFFREHKYKIAEMVEHNNIMKSNKNDVLNFMSNTIQYDKSIIPYDSRILCPKLSDCECN